MNLKKTLLVVAALCLIASTPLAADLWGTWAGSGKGNCYPHPGVVIYPWQNWKGEVYKTEDQDAPIFEGEWYDELGNYGTFKGNIYFPPIEEEAIAEGEWTWYDPDGTSAEPVVGGKFKMTFMFIEDYCKGSWKTIWPSTSAVGTMEGKDQD
ncbi:hypothetical protein GX441_08640 [bacterium]|nr:hypothetical protein [bacterium]